MSTVAEPAENPRRNLVIVRATDSSQHESWLTATDERTWDLIIGYTGNNPDRFRRSQGLRMDIRAGKWPLIPQVLERIPETIGHYDYIWLPDDAVQADTISINAMFDICAEYELSLAHPSFTPDSHIDHEISRAAPGTLLRYTNYAGRIAPCFSREFLIRCLPDFDTSSGPGLESLWPTMLGDRDIAVIDAVSVRNTGSVRDLAPASDAELAEYDRFDELVARGEFNGLDDIPDVRVESVHYRRLLDAKHITPVEPEILGEVAAEPDADPITPRLAPRSMTPGSRKPLDPADCVVLVPVADAIEPDCARALFELEQRGYPVWRHYGASGIDMVRGQMATDALAAGYDELMWIDADVVFPVDAVHQLRALDLPISCAIYPRKGHRELVVHLEPGTASMTFGEEGGLRPIKYGATGFLHTARRVYEEIQRHEQLPICNEHFGRPIVPYFMPMTVPDGEHTWYLGEDFSFCERARRSGFEILADTRIRLGHIGRQTYGWEDAGSTRERFATFTFNF